jgi:hypothetical protein
VRRAAQHQQHGHAVEQIDALDHRHRQPGVRRDERERSADRFEQSIQHHDQDDLCEKKRRVGDHPEPK